MNTVHESWLRPARPPRPDGAGKRGRLPLAWIYCPACDRQRPQSHFGAYPHRYRRCRSCRRAGVPLPPRIPRPKPPRKRDSRATPRVCIDCGIQGWGSRSWSQNTRRCQACRKVRRAARESRRREAQRLRGAGLTYFQIADRLDCEVNIAWHDVNNAAQSDHNSDRA